VLGAGSVGWDWIGINLDDGGALMAFRIRDAAAAPSTPTPRCATPAAE
jgi:predicted secreted hydrolase